MTEIEVTFKDMYQSGTETVVMYSTMAQRFQKLSKTEQARYLPRLETVAFTDIYDVKIKILSS